MKKDGDFLVREKSDGSGTFVASVMCRGLFKHFLMSRTEDVSIHKVTGLYSLL